MQLKFDTSKQYALAFAGGGAKIQLKKKGVLKWAPFRRTNENVISERRGEFP